MTGVELATGYISIVPEGSRIAPEVRKQFGKVGTEATRAGKESGKKFGGAFSSGLKLLGGAAIGGGVISFLKDSNAEAREAQKVGALTAQTIKSTGGAAKISANQVGALATAISNKSGIDDEAIQSASNLLLTFTNVRNEVGKSNDIFNQATQAATDMGAALGGDPKSSAIQLGKALNDPIKGVTALSRVGVSFTQQQKDQIKTLVKSGKTIEAQKIILGELRKEFGGAAAAQATSGDKAAVAVGNLKEQIGTALLPVVDKFARFTSEKVVPAVSDFVQGMQDGSGAGGDVADALKDVYNVGKKTFEIIDGLPGPVKKFGAEGLIALAVFSKFRSVLGPATSSIGAFATSLKNAEGKGTKLGVGIANLAGAGGMVLLADSANETGTAVGGLKAAAGGALAGLGVGGPLGAAIGGTAGLLYGLGTQTNRVADEFNDSRKAVRSFKESLDQTNGSITEATNKQALLALQNKKGGTTALEAGKLLGLSQREIVGAAVGNAKDLATVNAALARGARLLGEGTVPHLENGADAYNALKQSLFGYGKFSKGVAGDLRTQRAELLQEIAATKDYGTTLNALPPSKKIQVEATGIVPTLSGIAQVAARIHATPSELTTLVTAAGVSYTAGQLQLIVDKQHAIENTPVAPKVDPKPANSALADLLNASKTKAAATSPQISPKVATSGAYTELSGLLASLQTTANNRPVSIRTTVSGPPGRAKGGPVTAGQPYIVGEKRPELFVPSQSGRILASVPSARTASGISGGGGIPAGPMTIVIDDMEFSAYIEAKAQDQIARAS